jgi:hypothetical protein
MGFSDFPMLNTQKKGGTLFAKNEEKELEDCGLSTSGFQGSKFCDFKIQNIKPQQFSNREKESGTRTSGFWGSEPCEFKCPNINMSKPLKCEKGRWDPYFGFSGLGTS